MKPYFIYFDESIKLDQPNGTYSYYGAIGMDQQSKQNIVNHIEEIKETLHSPNELHFVNYVNDSDFEKYFRMLNSLFNYDIQINIIIVEKESAKTIAEQMDVSLASLRELFYVKIPERLFYGLAREKQSGQKIEIMIDENSEYKKIHLESKIKEQMNAHSAYRNIGYRVENVRQYPSHKSVPLQIIDVFMGMVMFIIEKRYETNGSITSIVKSDLIYRFLKHEHNLGTFLERIHLYEWSRMENDITERDFSKNISGFIMYKTKFDIMEMNRLSHIMARYPNESTKFYRKQMGYPTRQLRMIQGYLAELQGKGRNSFYE